MSILPDLILDFEDVIYDVKKTFLNKKHTGVKNKALINHLGRFFETLFSETSRPVLELDIQSCLF